MGMARGRPKSVSGAIAFAAVLFVVPLLLAACGGSAIGHHPAGSRIEAVGPPLCSTLVHAAQEGHVDMVAKLLDAGVHPDVPNCRRNYRSPEPPLRIAARKGYADIVRLLLEGGADVNSGGGHESPLVAAVGNGHIAVVRLLLAAGATTEVGEREEPLVTRACGCGHGELAALLAAHGADIDVRSRDDDWAYATGLGIAARRGDVETMSLLLDQGADPVVRDGDGRTPLLAACDGGYAEAALLLLKNGATVDEADSGGIGWTALHYAARSGDETLATLLLERGAHADARDSLGVTPLLLAAEWEATGIARALIAAGANVNVKATGGDYADHTPLVFACRGGNAELAELLLREGATFMLGEHAKRELFEAVSSGSAATVAVLGRHGMNLEKAIDASEGILFPPSYQGHTELLALLLEKGADPNDADTNGATPLINAAAGGRLDAAGLLVRHGADIDMRMHKGDFIGFSALSFALHFGHPEVAELLLDSGAALSERFETRYFAGKNDLMLAVDSGFVGATARILDRGGDIDARYPSGAGLLVRAMYREHRKLAQLLIRRGADLDGADSDGETPLMAAVRKSDVPLARYLLLHGADVNAADTSGETALHRAARRLNETMIELLLAYGADIGARGADGSDAAAIVDEMMSEHGSGAYRERHRGTMVVLTRVRERLRAAKTQDGGKAETR